MARGAPPKTLYGILDSFLLLAGLHIWLAARRDLRPLQSMQEFALGVAGAAPGPSDLHRLLRDDGWGPESAFPKWYHRR